MNTSKMYHLQQQQHAQLQKHTRQIREALVAAFKALPESPVKEKVWEALKVLNP